MGTLAWIYLGLIALSVLGYMVDDDHGNAATALSTWVGAALAIVVLAS